MLSKSRWSKGKNMAKNHIVSIDIGTNAIKLIQLEPTASGLRLVGAGVEPLPRHRATDDIPSEAIVQALQNLWKKVGGRQKTVVLAIPRLLVTARRLTNLPATATDEQLSGLAAMQAETELPFRAENAVFDYHDVRRSSNAISVELIAAKRDTVAAWIDYLKPLGVVPKSILPSSLAIAVLAGRQLANAISDGENQMTMVVDIGAGHTDVCFMAGERLRFSRSFPVGGNHLTRLYEKGAEVSFEAAEARKVTHATLERHSEAAAPAYEWAERLIAELNRSITGARRELDIENDGFVSAIWLCGGSSRVPGLANYVAERLRIQTRLWSPLDAFKLVCDEQRSDAQAINGFQDTLAVALGLGVNAATKQISLDLLPKEEKAKLTQAEQRQRFLLGAAAALVLIAALGLGGFAWNRAHQAKLADLDQQIRVLRNAEASAKKALVKELAISDLLTPHLSPLDILRELSVRFADRTQAAWTTFSLARLDEPDKAKVTFTIESSSHEAISKMLSVMAQSGIFTNIKSGQVTSVEREGKPTFQAQITSNLASHAVEMFARSRYLNQGAKPATEESAENVARRDGRAPGRERGDRGNGPGETGQPSTETLPPPDDQSAEAETPPEVDESQNTGEVHIMSEGEMPIKVEIGEAHETKQIQDDQAIIHAEEDEEAQAPQQDSAAEREKRRASDESAAEDER
jgi:type IV pilus assembly protein PilM